MGKRKILLIQFMLFIMGCSSSYRTIITNEKFDNSDFTGRNMCFIFFPEDSVNVKNIDDVIDDFNCDKNAAKDIIRDSSYKYIVEESWLWLQDVNIKELNKNQAFMTNDTDTSKYFAFSKILGKDSSKYKFYLPSKSYLNSKGIEPDIIVVLNKLEFSRTPVEYSMERPRFNGMYQGTYKYKNDNLRCDVIFSVWDYKENDVIIYGAFSEYTLPVINMTEYTWHKAFEDITKRIFLFSPFHWEYNAKKLMSLRIKNKDSK